MQELTTNQLITRAKQYLEQAQSHLAGSESYLAAWSAHDAAKTALFATGSHPTAWDLQWTELHSLRHAVQNDEAMLADISAVAAVTGLPTHTADAGIDYHEDYDPRLAARQVEAAQRLVAWVAARVAPTD